MASRQSALREASRAASWSLRLLGRELRVARITGGMTQRAVGARIGRAASHVSRVEHGLIAGLTMDQLYRHAAAVGLKPFVNLYPSVARPLDHAQLSSLSAFRSRLHHTWRVDLEVPMPIAGDLRAADAVISRPGLRIMVEVITRLADFQAQLRAARRKVRDMKADRLLFVVAATATNRHALRDAGAAGRDAFPIGTRAALSRLTIGEDPGGDALILLRAAQPASRRMAASGVARRST
jgi:transcriptional regulator with XRE-family HTH domain